VILSHRLGHLFSPTFRFLHSWLTYRVLFALIKEKPYELSQNLPIHAFVVSKLGMDFFQSRTAAILIHFSQQDLYFQLSYDTNISLLISFKI
jgi:hypothetical protein